MFCCTPSVWAATAEEYFADGNRLFRDKLYWASLLRYSEAAEAGMDSPLLDYNTGVAHYHARQYQRAYDSLLEASRYVPLQVIAFYNLGLTSYAMDDKEQAKVWFERVINQPEQREIRRLAEQALEELSFEEDTDEEIVVETLLSDEEDERPLTRLRLRVRTGVANDDNVYRSPSVSYTDLSDPTQPVVTPEIQSGLYVPFSLRAQYQVNALENEGFFGAYRFGGRFYQDEMLTLADEYLHELAFGSEFVRREEDRETRVYSAFTIAQHDEIFFDPDNGQEFAVNGTDVSKRMSYLRYGPEFWTRHRFNRLTLGIRAKGQLWNYEQVEEIPEYDHEYWNVGLTGQYRFTQTSLLRLSAEYYTRRFGDRPSFEPDGSQQLLAPKIRYDYLEYGIEARQSITSVMWFSLNYARTERTDRYKNYNDYLRDNYGAILHFQFGNRFELEAAGNYSIYNFTNAFAFNNPSAGPKTLETATGRAILTFRMTEGLDLIAEFQYQDVVSNDLRIGYERTQSLLAIRWTH